MEWIYEEGYCDAATRDKDWLDYGNMLNDGREPAGEYQRVTEVVGRFCADKTKAELLDAALDRILLIAPISTPRDLLDSAHFREREFFEAVEDQAALAREDSCSRAVVPLLAHQAVATRAGSPARRAHRAGAGRPPRPRRANSFDAERIPSSAPGGREAPRPQLGDSRTDHRPHDGGLRGHGRQGRDRRSSGRGPGVGAVYRRCPRAGLVRVAVQYVRRKTQRQLRTFATPTPVQRSRTWCGGPTWWSSRFRRGPEQAWVWTINGWPRSGPTSSCCRPVSSAKPARCGAVPGLGRPAPPSSASAISVAGRGGRPEGLGVRTRITSSPRFALCTLLAALDHRRRTGEGQYLDFAQAEATAHFLTPALLDEAVNHKGPVNQGNTDPHMAPHGVYPCAGDDQWVAIACRHDEDWRAFASVLGRPDLAPLGLSSRQARLTELEELISSWTKRTFDRRRRDGCDLGRRSCSPGTELPGMPGRSPVATPQPLPDPPASPTRHDHPGELPDHHVRHPGPSRANASSVGQDTFEVLTEILGYDPEHVGQLLAGGVLD